MKTFLRFTALLLCAVMPRSAVACVKDAEEGIPEGMQLAVAANSDFRLFIPTTWNINTAYGVSGGYFILSTQSNVSVVKYAITDDMSAAMQSVAAVTGEERIQWFFANEALPAVAQIAFDGAVKEEAPKEATLLGDANAWRYHHSAYINQKTLHILHVIAERENAFYVFSFTCEDSHYSTLLTDVEKMLEEFYFDKPYVSDSYAKPLDQDATAPNGMQLASNDDVAYRFYVPTAWTVDREQEIFAAYTEDRSGVSIVPYMPEVESLSVGDFFTMCREMMESTAGTEGFEMLAEETKVDLGGREATVYVYRYTVGGREYRYKQVVAAYKSMIYSLTYTSTPEHFDTHLGDVDKIIEAFEFR